MKRLERLIVKYILRIAYIFSSIFKIKKRIIFATYRTDTLEGNYKYIIEELEKRNTGYSYKILYKPQKNGIKEKIKYLFHMIRAEYYMATSNYFIIDDFYLPVYVVEKLRKGTEVVQVWHACGAFKKFGFSILDRGFGADEDYIKDIPIHSNYSNVLVTSKEVSKYYAEAFNMSDINIKPIGIPRTDIFFYEEKKMEAKEKLYKLYPKLIGKKIILYAPTFRGTSQRDAKSEIKFNLKKVLESIEDDYIFALKMHPFVKESFKELENDKFIDLSDYSFINDILCITEILITDYSSTLFEFSLLEKKIILYADDLDEYINERDFYYEYNSFVPGPIVNNTADLINIINDENYDYNKVREFKNKFFDYVDGKASKRFVDKIICKN